MGSQERPSFFCSRPDGTLTPLLAVDELPLTLSIRGVSRTLTPGDTQGMTSCGVAPPRTDHWVVDGPPAGSRVTNDDKMNELHNLLYKILREEDVSSEVRSSIQEILFRGFDAPTPVPALAPATVAGAGQNRKDSPNFGYGGNFHGNHKNPHNKKSYCSYWLRHGECDYSQQGCLFKHEMPMDLVMLDKLGLRDIPRWYREKFGVPSLLHSNYGNHRGGHNQYFALSEHAHPANQSSQRAIEWSLPAEGANTHDHRGKQGRYRAPKSPRGPGFRANKNHDNWNKQSHGRRNNYCNPFDATPSFSSASRDSSEGSFVMPKGPSNATDIPNSSAQLNPGLVSSMGRCVLDKEGKATKKSDPTALMAKLDTKDPIGESSKSAFRTKSRRPYEYGGDSHIKTPVVGNTAAGNTAAGNTVTRPATAERAPLPSFQQRRNMYSTLLADSEPIHPRDMQFNFGPIGEPVQCPGAKTECPNSSNTPISIFGVHPFFPMTENKNIKGFGGSDNV